MSSSNIHSTLNFTSSSAVTAPPLPSVFELLAQERLTDLIRPCLRHVLKFLHESRPWSNLLRTLYAYKDEFILLIEGVVQWLYLHFYSALVGERFYGLKRTADHQLRSLIISVFLPYVKLKLDQLYEQMRTNTDNRRRSFYVILAVLPKVQVSIPQLNSRFEMLSKNSCEENDRLLSAVVRRRSSSKACAGCIGWVMHLVERNTTAQPFNWPVSNWPMPKIQRPWQHQRRSRVVSLPMWAKSCRVVYSWFNSPIGGIALMVRSPSLATRLSVPRCRRPRLPDLTSLNVNVPCVDNPATFQRLSLALATSIAISASMTTSDAINDARRRINRCPLRS